MRSIEAIRSSLHRFSLPEPVVNRMVGLAMVVPSGAVLGIARWLVPNPAGLGTHRQLGLSGCVVLTLTGVPCPMCGMTTTFALMADGRPLAALANQPFGVVLFSATILAFLLGLLDVLRGRGAWRGALRWVLERETVIAFAILGGLFIGWTYKILLVEEILPSFLDGLRTRL